jgi:flagellar motor switch protein FliM
VTRILSQAEIDALLVSVPDGATDGGADQAGPPDAGPVIAYDFRRPDRVSKEQLRSLHLLHDRFSRNVTTSLSAYLRTGVELAVSTVEQFSYSEFLMSLPDPTAFYGIKISTFDGLGALEMNPAVAFTIVDRMLGGSGRGTVPDRALTEIEQTVVDSVVKILLEHLTETWRAFMEVKFSIEARETRPQMLPIAGRNEVMILMGFDIKVGDVRSMLHVCVPAAAVEASGLSFGQSWQHAVPDPTAVQRARMAASLSHVSLPVTALLESRLRAREVLRLQVGDVVSLGVSVKAPVKVRVANRIKYLGRLSLKEERAAVVLERVADSTHAGELR